MPEKQLRCGDCKMCWLLDDLREHHCGAPWKMMKKVNPGWYAGKCFVYKDK